MNVISNPKKRLILPKLVVDSFTKYCKDSEANVAAPILAHVISKVLDWIW